VALEGDLQNIQLADIFQSLQSNRQVGTLIVSSRDREKRFAFEGRGVALLTRRTLEGSRLGEFLVGRGLISDSDLKLALMQQRKSGYPLGRVLVEKRIVDARSVEDVLRYHAAEEIYEVFEWRTGSFQFVPGEPDVTPGEASPFAGVFFDPGGVVLEAARRLDEWELIRETFPTPRDFLVLAREPEEGEVEDNDLARLLDLLDGTRDLERLGEDYYLSPFDLQRSLRELVLIGLVRPLEAEELVRSATLRAEEGELFLAIAMLERAGELDSENPDVFDRLARICREAGDEVAAARWLMELSRTLYRDGKYVPAGQHAQEALTLDDHNLEALELLGLLATRGGEPGEALELACQRVAILRERKEFPAAAAVCEEMLALPDCESFELLVHHGCCLASLRQPEEAIVSFETASKIAWEQGRVAEACEVFKRILAIDPEHEDARARLRAAQDAEHKRRRRRSMAIVGAAAVLVLAGVGLLTLRGSDDLDAQIAAVHASLRSGKLDEARRAAESLAARIPDDDERSVALANLRAEITRRASRRRGPGEELAQQLAAAFNPLLVEAARQFERGRPLDGLRSLERARALLDGELAQELRKKDGRLYGKIRTDDLHEIGASAGQGLHSTVTFLQADRQFVEELRRKELIRAGPRTGGLTGLQRMVSRLGAIRTRSIDVDAVCELALALGEASKQEKMIGVAAEQFAAEHALLRTTQTRAESLEHVIRAQLRRPELTARYARGMTAGRLDRDEGRLEESRRTFAGLLDYFREIEALRPAEPYAALVALIRQQGLWDEAEKELQNLEAILEDLARARLHLAEHQFARAQQIYLRLLAEHPVIDFREHIRLPLRLTTRPPGAEVRLNGVAQGRTPLVLSLPYASQSEIVLSLPTFREASLRVDGVDSPGPAVRHLDLDKVPHWIRETEGPLARCIGIAGSRIVLGGRDGVLRVLETREGRELRRHTTGLIEGFAAEPAIRDSRVWLIAKDGRVLHLDAAGPDVEPRRLFPDGKGAVGLHIHGDDLVLLGRDGSLIAARAGVERWRVPIEGRVLDTPLLTDGRIVLGTATGEVVCLSAASGAVLWRRDLGASVRHAPTRSRGHVLVGQDEGVICALDLGTGEPRWTRRIGSAVATRILSAYGLVHVGALDGKIHRLSESNGNPVDHLAVGGPISTELVVRDGHLFVGTREGRACAFDLSRGSLLWSFDLGSEAVGTPLVYGDIVLFASARGRLAAFR
jgi:outer membrane protein assembly factor BamB/tetratricopeptide (TPR) repeat protein